jgi:hypothetical protein
MTKAELARRLVWRFKVVQQAGERSRNVARTLAFRGKRSIDGSGDLTPTVEQGYRTGPARPPLADAHVTGGRQ